MMVVTIASGTRTARKSHHCWHCQRSIEPGQSYGYQTNKYDYVYTIAWHLDCERLSSECIALADYYFDDEGFPGLREMWCDQGEYYDECDRWRGFYPHVIARMELTDQLRAKAKE